jgi:CheY-like chemotaxis protein
MARILLVDDEEDILWGLSDSLRKEGFEVLTATNGKEAIDHLEQGPVDLMITDIRMPGMSGVELLLKAKEMHPDLKVIVMTAYGSDDLRKEVIEGGALHYLEKPFDFEDLYVLVEKCVREKGPPQPWELADVLQLLNLEGRSATIKVKINDKSGTIAVKDGEPWDAEWNGLHGKEAFVEILSQPEVEYDIEFEFKGDKRRIDKPLYALILEAVAGVDEIKREEAVSILSKIGEREPKEEKTPKKETQVERVEERAEDVAEQPRPVEVEKPRYNVKKRERLDDMPDDVVTDIIEKITETLGYGLAVSVVRIDGTTVKKVTKGVDMGDLAVPGEILGIWKLETWDEGEIEEVTLRTRCLDLLIRPISKDHFLVLALPKKSPKLGMARVLLSRLEMGEPAIKERRSA